MDQRLRTLQRQAAEGDERAQILWAREIIRSLDVLSLAQGLPPEAFMRAQADLVADKIADELDLANVANEIDLNDLASEIDVQSIAEYVDTDDIASTVGDNIYASEVAEHIDVNDVANEIDVDNVAGCLDLDELAAKVADRLRDDVIRAAEAAAEEATS